MWGSILTTTLLAALGIPHDVPPNETTLRVAVLVAWLGMALLDVLGADLVRELLRDYDGAAGGADKHLDDALRYGTETLEACRQVNKRGVFPSPSKDPWRIGG